MYIMSGNTQIHDELMNIGQSACPFYGLLLVKGDTLVPQRWTIIGLETET